MANFDQLSKRELEIVQLAAKGKLDKEIVSELGVSINTLRTYWNRIRAKMGDQSRSAFAAAWVSEAHLRKPEPTPVDDSDFQLSWQVDLTNNLVLAPDSVNQFHGLKCGQWHPRELYHNDVHPDDRALVGKAIQAACLAGKDHFTVNHRSIRKGRMTYDHSFGTIVRDGKGKAVRVVAQTVRLQDAFDSGEIMVGLFSKNLTTGILRLDNACFKIFELPNQVDDSNLEAAIRQQVALDDLPRLDEILFPKPGLGMAQSSARLRLNQCQSGSYFVEVRSRSIGPKGASTHISGSFSRIISPGHHSGIAPVASSRVQIPAVKSPTAKISPVVQSSYYPSQSENAPTGAQSW